MPKYQPAGEDAPNAMMAQAAQERYDAYIFDDSDDPIAPGWPGPMSSWTPEMLSIFREKYDAVAALGEARPECFTEGYRAVVHMPQGRRRRSTTRTIASGPSI